MKKKQTIQTTQPAADGDSADPNTIPSSVTTRAEALAAEMIAKLDEFQALVPDYRPYDSAMARKVAAAARYSNDVIPPAIVLATFYQPPSGVVSFDVNDGRETLAFSEAMIRVRARMGALFADFEFVVDYRKAVSATQALALYTWAKAHAKGLGGVGVLPYYAALKRAVAKVNHRSKKKRRKRAPAPKTAASAEPTPSPSPDPVRDGREDELAQPSDSAMKDRKK